MCACMSLFAVRLCVCACLRATGCGCMLAVWCVRQVPDVPLGCVSVLFGFFLHVCCALSFSTHPHTYSASRPPCCSLRPQALARGENSETPGADAEIRGRPGQCGVWVGGCHVRAHGCPWVVWWTIGWRAFKCYVRECVQVISRVRMHGWCLALGAFSPGMDVRLGFLTISCAHSRTRPHTHTTCSHGRLLPPELRRGRAHRTGHGLRAGGP